MKHEPRRWEQSFPEDFERIDDVAADDKILIWDESTQTAAFAYPSQIGRRWAPIIKEAEDNNVSSYRLIIRTNEGKFTTPNLMAPVLDAISQYDSKYEFPNVGDSHILYVDQSENKVYRWDNSALKYFCVGADYNDVDIIYGGDAEGLHKEHKHHQKQHKK